jgi:putative FmdB family regulatory protein
MPIYEYRCGSCGRPSSIFFRSIAAVEAEPACPRCGERALTRRVSRVWSHRARDADSAPEPADHDDVPFYGGDPYGDDDVMGDGDWEGSDEDVATMAREAREMARMMGEPLEPEFDQALRHIEHGADPDDVFGEFDAAATQEDEPLPE